MDNISKFISSISKLFNSNKNPLLPVVPSRKIKLLNSQKDFNKKQGIQQRYIRNQRTNHK